MNMNMKVTIHGTEELAIFIAGLAKEGVTFEALPQQNDLGVIAYIVELTGGY
jgi:hypothetical protein